MNPIDALRASGLNPVVIDEDFDFNSLNDLFTVPATATVDELRHCVYELCMLLEGCPDDDTVHGAVGKARKLINS